MPQFTPGVLKTARSPITVKPAGLSCQAELYLVSGATKVATSGLKPFSSTGAEQNITFPITMPGAQGTYRVYLDIFAAGILIAAYIATEDVTIIPVPWVYSDVRAWRGRGLWNYLGVEIWQTIDFSVVITNPGVSTATKTVQLFGRRYFYGDEGYTNPDGSPYMGWGGVLGPLYAISLTLSPGQNYTLATPTGGDTDIMYTQPGWTFEFWWVDSDGQESARVQYTAPAS